MRKSIWRIAVIVITVVAATLTGGQVFAQSSGGASTQIVGGSNATEHYGAATVQLDGRVRCSGSLIASQWVITAGHCLGVVIPGRTIVRAGSLETHNGGEKTGVMQGIRHPGFNGVLQNDIMLVKLANPVRVPPLPIAAHAGEPGTTSRVAGWGDTCQIPGNPNCGVISPLLQQLDVRRVESEQCKLLVNGNNIFDPATQLCIEDANGGYAMACYGDSGGPQVRMLYGKWQLVGTVTHDGDDWNSRPYDCTTQPSGAPGRGVSMNIPVYVQWIMDTMRANGDPRAADEVAALRAVR